MAISFNQIYSSYRLRLMIDTFLIMIFMVKTYLFNIFCTQELIYKKKSKEICNF